MQSVKYLMGTTALAGAMLASATVQAADYTVPSDLLSDVQGYIDAAGNDDLKSRWEAAYATLTGNIEWVPAQEVEVKDEVYGDYTKIVEGYWGVKGKDGMRAITLGSASLYADLHKAKRWTPVKKAIRKLLRNDMYGVAMVVEAPKPFYEQWGGWNDLGGYKTLKSNYKALVAGLPTPGSMIASPFVKYEATPPVDIGNKNNYEFKAGLDNMVSLHKNLYPTDGNIGIVYDSVAWSGSVSYGMHVGSPTAAERRWTYKFNNLEWTNGATATDIRGNDGTNGMLTAQFYRNPTAEATLRVAEQDEQGQTMYVDHEQHRYQMAGGVVTEHMAATFTTNAELIPDN